LLTRRVRERLPLVTSLFSERVRMVTDGFRPFCWAVWVSDDAVEIRIEVSGEGDPVRDERAARRLRDDLLARDDVVGASFAPSDSVPTPGTKGPGATDTVVLVTTVAPFAAATVIAFIRAWADRSSRRKVVVSSDGSVEVHGGIGRREEQLLRDLRGIERDPVPGREDPGLGRTPDDSGG
jgi:hypothetical protein